MILVGAALAAGYGVPVDGHPSAVERSVVLWTNAARVAPEEFGDDYAAGGCSTDDFSEDELTPKAPLYVDLALTEVARAHSEDMDLNGCFQHESCDGTDTFTRIAQYYTESSYVGENIASGTSDARTAVMSMWMCSHSGHRANIMSGDYDEMGAGVSGTLMTQDFASGGVLPEGTPPVRVAAEQSDGQLLADWSDDSPPARLDLVTADEVIALDLEFGEPENGIYAHNAPEEGTPWRLVWSTKAGVEGAWPAEGALVAYREEWTEESPGGPGGAEAEGGCGGAEAADDDLSAGGCGTAPASGLGLLGAILAARRRAGRTRA